MILRKVEDKEGTKVGGSNIGNLRYADDAKLEAESIFDRKAEKK